MTNRSSTAIKKRGKALKKALGCLVPVDCFVGGNVHRYDNSNCEDDITVEEDDKNNDDLQDTPLPTKQDGKVKIKSNNENETTPDSSSPSCFSALVGGGGLHNNNDNNRHQRQARRIVPMYGTFPPAPRGCVTSLLNPAGGGQRDHIEDLIHTARTFASKGQYAQSIRQYTAALTRHAASYRCDKMLSLLLANRAEMLITVGAFEAAALDCQRAFQLSCSGRDCDPSVSYSVLETGPCLKSRILALWGEALLRLGRLDEATGAFNRTIETVRQAMKQCQMLDGDSKKAGEEYMTQLSMSATTGLSETQRCREAIKQIHFCGVSRSSTSHASERESFLRELANIDLALNVSFGDTALHHRRIAYLVHLQHWQDVVDHCELLASTQVNLDGVFTGDLSKMNPYPGVAPAKYLEAMFFQSIDEYKMIGLDTEEVKEAVLRLPEGVILSYLQGLRLEERLEEAQASMEALQEHQWRNKRKQHVWLSIEVSRLNRTISLKDQGYALMRRGDYKKSARIFTTCLSMDDKIKSIDLIGERATVGGRLNVVLHCSRAACFISMGEYNAAITDCTSALQIRPNFMMAILLRCRCYALLQRYDESIAQYNHWLLLVKVADKDDRGNNLDGAANISYDKVKSVEQELQRVVKAKQEQKNGTENGTSGGTHTPCNAFAAGNSGTADCFAQQNCPGEPAADSYHYF